MLNAEILFACALRKCRIAPTPSDLHSRGFVAGSGLSISAVEGARWRKEALPSQENSRYRKSVDPAGAFSETEANGSLEAGLGGVAL